MAEPTSLKYVSSEVVALTTTSAPCVAAIGTANTAQPNYVEVVRLCSTVDCWIAFGSAPVAVAASGAASILLPAGVVEYFDIPAGQKVAGIVASGTGSLSVAKMGK